jgi:hypothetical protein
LLLNLVEAPGALFPWCGCTAALVCRQTGFKDRPVHMCLHSLRSSSSCLHLRSMHASSLLSRSSSPWVSSVRHTRHRHPVCSAVQSLLLLSVHLVSTLLPSVHVILWPFTCGCLVWVVFMWLYVCLCTRDEQVVWLVGRRRVVSLFPLC